MPTCVSATSLIKAPQRRAAARELANKCGVEIKAAISPSGPYDRVRPVRIVATQLSGVHARVSPLWITSYTALLIECHNTPRF
jgi:uncharacterized protein with GYD domain